MAVKEMDAKEMKEEKVVAVEEVDEGFNPEKLIKGDTVKYVSKMKRLLIPFGKETKVMENGEYVVKPAPAVQFEESVIELDPQDADDLAKIKFLEGYDTRGINYERVDKSAKRKELQTQAGSFDKMMKLKTPELIKYFERAELIELGIDPDKAKLAELQVAFLNLGKRLI